MESVGDYHKWEERPILIFWETTKACDLSCIQCRALAMKDPQPGELDPEESLNFVRSLKDFGKPYPVVILSGGDVMKKSNLEEIARELHSEGIRYSISPSATNLVTEEKMQYLKDNGMVSVSLSLDGGSPEIHDKIRGVKGAFQKTMDIIDLLSKLGIKVQINTTVMRENISELPRVFSILRNKHISTWEVFFLVNTGKASELKTLDSVKVNDVNKWLVFASFYGMNIRTVESPIFRRIQIDYMASGELSGGKIFEQLKKITIDNEGKPDSTKTSPVGTTWDGNGIVFVSHDGKVYPSGFLPVEVGNIREKSIVEIYRTSGVMKLLRDPSKFSSKCAICAYNGYCPGSRARSYNLNGDPFGNDPMCDFDALHKRYDFTEVFV
ncbi:TIGR04053 family radical SAM/SPASM domain-containing protein [Oxyplasma meridianum]|uniref:TIGR04053 family radical SAM/SPASM domain-containing protein n=1 Tax=Oxyplasma meridianum TaxID=3073602 RepID=A0AAX4NHF0_9ARCH